MVYFFYLKRDDSFGEDGDRDRLQVGHVGLDTWCCIQECKQCLFVVSSWKDQNY